MSLEAPTTWRQALRTYLLDPSADLLVALAYVVLAAGSVIAIPGLGLFRVLLALPLVLFVPGYLLTVALFPRERHRVAPETERGLDTLERLALSVGLSVAVVPLIAGTVGLVGFELALTPLALGLALTCALAFVVATIRRERLPPAERFDPSVSALVAYAGDVLTDDDSGVQTGLNVVLALAVVLTGGVLVAAMVSPTAGTANTNLLLLTENETGQYVAGDYPASLSTASGTDLVVGVQNHEGKPVEYTVVVELQTVDNGTVAQRTELRELSEAVAAGETWYAPHTVSPNRTGTDMRLTYLLYRGDPPSGATDEEAYRTASLWVDVE